MACQTVVLDGAGMAGLVTRLSAMATGASEAGRRLVVGIGGVAGSGKSTLADRLAEGVGGAVVFGIDGFHLPNARLRELGRYERKGAPDTYDAGRFVQLLARYRDATAGGPYPVYDRERTHEPVTASQPVDDQVRVILAEGQFVLLDEPPWRRLAEVLDAGWWLDTPLDTARQWVVDRHMATGRTAKEAEAKYANDRRNAEHLLARMRPPDLRLAWP